MGQTLTEKIIAKAAGVDSVSAGEIVICKIDLAMIHDSGGPRRVSSKLEQLGVGVWDPDKVVLISDHYVPAVDAQSAAILKFTRDWAHKTGVDNFYDQQGICHVILPERGHLTPGMFVAGGDSHSPTGGAFGCYMFGVGATDMAGILATGETWIKVPSTILLEWNGKLPIGTCSKDMMLKTCATLGMDGGDYQAIQFAGDTVLSLPMTERMTMSNMAAELGAQAGLIEPDQTTMDYIREAGGTVGNIEKWRSDENATYREKHSFDASLLQPQIALPHSPANAVDVDNAPPVQLDQCYIGACTGAKLIDLQMAATVLKGRKVSTKTRLLVAPASTRVTAAAAKDGTLEILTEAGALLMPSGCGACAGYGAGVLAEDEVCMSSTARNFKGRMGAQTSKVYLGSPYSVAAAAIYGHVADPREFLKAEAE